MGNNEKSYLNPNKIRIESVKELINFNRKLPKIERVFDKSNIELSFNQEELVNKKENGVDDCVYKIPMAFYVKGMLNCEILEKSIIDIMKNNDAFKIAIKTKNNEYSQMICDNLNFTINQKFINENITDINVFVAGKTKELMDEMFDFEKPPLLKAYLYRLKESENILFFIVHHIIFDGYSYSKFFNQLSSVYNAYINNMEIELPALPVDYLDYVVWQRMLYQKGYLNEHLKYWEKAIDNIEPYSSVYRGDKNYSCEILRDIIPKELHDDLKSISKELKISMFNCLLAVFFITLCCLTKNYILSAFIPMAGRNKNDLVNVLGYFNNNILITCNIEEYEKVFDLILGINESINKGISYQDIPFSIVQQHLKCSDRAFNKYTFAQYTSGLNFELEGTTVQKLGVDSMYNFYDIAMYMDDNQHNLEFIIKYNPKCFNEAGIVEFMKTYLSLIKIICKNQHMKISDLIDKWGGSYEDYSY